MLDFLPAWARHFVLMYAAIFGYIVATAIVKANGVTTVVWLGSDGVLIHGVDAAAVAVAASILLWLFPITKQYGYGQGNSAAMGSAGDVAPDVTVDDTGALLTAPVAPEVDPAAAAPSEVAP